MLSNQNECPLAISSQELGSSIAKNVCKTSHA